MTVKENISVNEWADFWRNQSGVNVIPATNLHDNPELCKKPFWTDSDGNQNWIAWSKYQTEPISQEEHDDWKNNNAFKDGMAIICGKVFHNKEFEGFWLNAIDCDDKSGVDAICLHDIEKTAQGTLVEQHANKNKCHVLCYSKEPLKNRALILQAPQIEIKSMGKNILYCAGGIHKDGSLIDIVGTRKIKIVDSTDLEKQLDKILKPFEKSSVVNETKDQLDNLQNKIEGTNRQMDLLSLVCKFAKQIDKGLLDEQDCINKAISLNCKLAEPYSESKAVEIGKSAYRYTMNDEEPPKTKKKVNTVYSIANEVMTRYSFITLEGTKSKDILFYNNGIYHTFGEDVISKNARKIEKVLNSDITEIKGVIRDATGYYSHDIFDKDSHILNLKSGLLNLRTGKEEPHDPKYLSRLQVPLKYDSEAKCPRFEKFLASSLDNDEKKITMVKEMMALCIIKDNHLLEKAFMHTGKGSNGKSVLFGILYKFLGKGKNVSTNTIHSFQDSNFATSSLEHKLANICADVGSKGIKETEELKKIIGGDPISCEPKFKDVYTFTPYATMIFSANDIPIVNDESDGFARRFELIEWTKSFYGKDRDHTVNDIKNSKEELSGILNMLIPIARRLLETRNLTYESTVEDAKIAWLRKSDSATRYIKENTVASAEHHEPVALIWSEYNKFAKANGMTPIQDREFNKKLESMGFVRKGKKISGSNIYSWIGFTIRTHLKKDSQSSL
jgi:P4 family phage/plasmid primase-like protien